MHKVCSKCGVQKELNATNFPVKNTGKDGFDCWCKKCKKEYDQKRYAGIKDKISKQKAEYYKKNKETLKEKTRNYYRKNKKVCNEREKSWRERNPEKRRIINTKARAFIFNSESKLTENEWKNIKEYFEHKCAYCGISEEESKEVYGERLHVEHFIALENGGKNVYENVIPACRSCNSSKSNKMFEDWYPQSCGYEEDRQQKIIRYINNKNRKEIPCRG